MKNWIPGWAKHAAFCFDEDSARICFSRTSSNAMVQAARNGKEWGSCDIEELKKVMAIADVCKQIKDKPLHSRIDVIGQNGNGGEHYDNVNKPEHYQGDGIECIDAIKAALGIDGFVAHCRATAIKYAWRSGKKKEHAEDLRKGAWYLNKAADALEGK